MIETEITISELDGSETKQTVQIQDVLVVGYGGRDPEKIQEHILELEEIGVAPPLTIPALYPQKLEVLTMDSNIFVEGKQTSGEVEYVLFHNGTEWLVTTGSDHTDRELEKIDVQKSKEVCPKPLGTVFWRLKDIENHWDEIILRSWVIVNQSSRLYQEHSLTALLPVDKLLERLFQYDYKELFQTVIFSGTVPTLEGLVFGDKFRYEICDPVLKRTIKGEYSIHLIQRSLEVTGKE
jgi:hypothetical protein